MIWVFLKINTKPKSETKPQKYNLGLSFMTTVHLIKFSRYCFNLDLFIFSLDGSDVIQLHL